MLSCIVGRIIRLVRVNLFVYPGCEHSMRFLTGFDSALVLFDERCIAYEEAIVAREGFHALGDVVVDTAHCFEMLVRC